VRRQVPQPRQQAEAPREAAVAMVRNGGGGEAAHAAMNSEMANDLPQLSHATKQRQPDAPAAMRSFNASAGRRLTAQSRRRLVPSF